MRLGLFTDRAGNELDQVMAVYMPAKRSYTGLEQVEIFCHGGRRVVKDILQQLLASGARAAEPGEFTKTAFINGRIDLARAEAVAELIAANTDAATQASREHLLGAYSEHVDRLREMILQALAEIEAAIDFPDDMENFDSRNTLKVLNEAATQIDTLVKSYQGGRLINEGFRIAIAGRPNAGKSSLFNLLLKQERALVSRTPGTTRDYLSEWIELSGIPVNLTDTAGLRKSGGEIEQAGQTRTENVMKRADLILWLVDLSKQNWKTALNDDLGVISKNIKILVGNKIDLLKEGPDRICGKFATLSEPETVVAVSCKTGTGLDTLKKIISQQIEARMPDLTSGFVVTSARQFQKLKGALKLVESADRKLRKEESIELVAFDLKEAGNLLSEITGHIYNEELLEKIFASFCIGK